MILAHARDLLADQGPGQLTLRSVAKSVGVTPMALYKHFENKEDLLLELLKQGFRTFDSYMASSDTGSTAENRLFLMIDGFWEFAVQEGAYFELIFLSGHGLDGTRRRKDIRDFRAPIFRRLVKLTQECIEEGYLADRGKREMAVTLLAQAIGVAAMYRSRLFGWSKKAAREAFDTSLGVAIDAYRI